MKHTIKKISIFLFAVILTAGLFGALPVQTEAASSTYVQGFEKHIYMDGSAYNMSGHYTNGTTVSVEIITDISFPLFEENANLKSYLDDWDKLQKLYVYWVALDEHSSEWKQFGEWKKITSDDIAPYYSIKLTRDDIGRTLRLYVYDGNTGNGYYGGQFYVYEDTAPHTLKLYGGSHGKVFLNDGGGSSISDSFYAEVPIAIEAVPNPGYRFSYWSYNAFEGTFYSSLASDFFSFKKDDSNASLYANFEYAGNVKFNGYYDDDVAGTGNPYSIEQLTLNGKTAKKGTAYAVNDQVTLNIRSRECKVYYAWLMDKDNFAIQELVLTNTKGNEYTSSFTVPEKDFQIMIGTDWEGQVPVEDVSIGPSKNIELAAKKTKQLTAEVLPSNAGEKGVTWTSSDPKVVSVSKTGKIKALKYGPAVEITAASNENLSIKDSCVVQPRFYDVMNPSKYYYDTVYWAADNGVVSGMEGGAAFGPEKDCTRKQMMIILWKFCGSPEPASTEMVFSDVKAGKNSATYKSILWGIEKGIVKGYSDGGFHPDTPLTRKQAMIMIYRIAGRPDVTGTMKFTDIKGGKNSDSYKAVLWASLNKITGGYSDGTFRPNESCLRKHIVTFIKRYYDMP